MGPGFEHSNGGGGKYRDTRDTYGSSMGRIGILNYDAGMGVKELVVG